MRRAGSDRSQPAADPLPERAARPGEAEDERRLWSAMAVTQFFLALDAWLERDGELIEHLDRVIDRTRRGFEAARGPAER